MGKGITCMLTTGTPVKKLFRHLEENGTAACGTAMDHRLTVPKSMIGGIFK